MKSRTKRTHRFSAQLAGFMRGPATGACTLLLFVACWSMSVSLCASAAGSAKGSVALNLSSTQATLSAGSALGSASSVKILVGNSMQTVTATSLLTPAEYLAAIQMATAGRQSIMVSGSGSATGGTFTTNSVSQTISALTVPSGVTAVDNFAASKNFSLTGDLVNAGTFYAVSTNKTVSTATISAADITNSGLLTSIVPAGGISGFSNLIGNLGLSLTAVNNILNNGTISSAGALSLTAGNSITNSSIGSTPALIQSAAGLNISAPTIISSAQISALQGNISVLTNSFTNSSLLQAMQGTLSFQNLSGTSLQIGGGTLEGTVLSLAAKQGTVLANVVDLPSTVDITANTFDLTVTNGTHGLSLSHVPTLTSATLSYNGAGDVSFHQFATAGGNVNVNTTGNISVLGPGNSQIPGSINTSPVSGSAGEVTLSAGGAISVGDISTAAVGNGNGGNITLDAGTTLTAGALNASGGALSGIAGNIIIKAGGAVTTGSITDSGSPGGTIDIQSAGAINVNGNLTAPGGSLSLTGTSSNITGKVNITGGTVSINDDDNGKFLVDLSQIGKFAGSNIQIGSLSDYTADIVLNADCKQCLSNVTSISFDTQGHFIGTGHTITLGSATDFSVVAEAGINTGSVLGARSVSFSTASGLTVDGNLSSKQGDIALTGGNINVLDSTAVSSSTGKIALTSTGNIGVGASSLSSSGGDVWLNAGGKITISHALISSISTTQNGTTNGGQIAINAGESQSDLASILAGLQAERVAGKETLSVLGGTLDSSNKINSSGGSLVEIVFPSGVGKSITNTTFNVNGGVIYVDPPSSDNVSINGATITATGTALTGGETGGGTGGGAGGGTGGGAGGGSLSGSINGDPASITGAVTGAFTSELPSGLPPATNFDLSGASSITTGRDNLGELNSDNAASVFPNDTTSDAWTQAIYCAQQGTLKENEKGITRDSWILAANKCQPFSFEAPDGSIIIGSGPAEFAPAAGHTLLLKQGKLLVIAGASMIVVRTPICNITVPVNSACTVEFDPSGLARLTSLAGGRASISLSRQGETMILSAAPGEQIILAESAVADTEIACQPPVSNKKIDSWMVRMEGVRGQKFSFDRSEMVAQEGLLNCTLGCFTKLQQAMIDQIRKSMLLEQPKELRSMLPIRFKTVISKATPATNHMQAVGFGKVLDLTVPDITTITAKSATVKYAANAAVSIDKPNALTVKAGDVIISASSPTDVTAGAYAIHLNAGTIAMISNRGDHVVVRNVYETRVGSISVSTPDKKVLGAQVGQELIIGHTGYSYGTVLSEDAVGRRRLRHEELGKLSNVLTSEVSLVSLLQNTDVLAQLTRSELPDDKALVNKLEKMAVVLSMITQGHGNYSIVGQ
ncbi:MAG TPA: hypothetical protein V6D22_22775 [Candidatus Obscuribacterales bacterium]